MNGNDLMDPAPVECGWIIDSAADLESLRKQLKRLNIKPHKRHKPNSIQLN
jgi:hypothetical protein